MTGEGDRRRLVIFVFLYFVCCLWSRGSRNCPRNTSTRQHLLLLLLFVCLFVCLFVFLFYVPSKDSPPPSWACTSKILKLLSVSGPHGQSRLQLMGVGVGTCSVGC